MSNKLPGDMDAAGPRTTLGVERSQETLSLPFSLQSQTCSGIGACPLSGNRASSNWSSPGWGLSWGQPLSESKITGVLKDDSFQNSIELVESKVALTDIFHVP